MKTQLCREAEIQTVLAQRTNRWRRRPLLPEEFDGAVASEFDEPEFRAEWHEAELAVAGFIARHREELATLESPTASHDVRRRCALKVLKDALGEDLIGWSDYELLCDSPLKRRAG